MYVLSECWAILFTISEIVQITLIVNTYWICINSLNKYHTQFSLCKMLYFTLKKQKISKNK